MKKKIVFMLCAILSITIVYCYASDEINNTNSVPGKKQDIKIFQEFSNFMEEIEKFLDKSIFVFALNDTKDYYICDINGLYNPFMDKNKVSLEDLRNFLARNFKGEKQSKLFSVNISFAPDVPCKRLYDFINKYEEVLEKDFEINRDTIKYRLRSPLVLETGERQGDLFVPHSRKEGDLLSQNQKLIIRTDMTKEEVLLNMDKAKYFKLGEIKDTVMDVERWLISKTGYFEDALFVDFKKGKVFKFGNLQLKYP